MTNDFLKKSKIKGTRGRYSFPSAWRLAACRASRAWHRDRPCACLARRDEEEHWACSTEEQRRHAGWMAGRMPRDLHHGLLATLLLVLVASLRMTAAQATDVGQESEIACAPRLAAADTSATLTILGSQEGTAKSYFGPSDTLVISGGYSAGVEVGQEYFVRRVVSSRFGDAMTPVLHTAGAVRIVAVDPDMSIAEVVRLCGGLQPGDFLQPLELPESAQVLAPGEPDFDNPGRILFGLDGRALIAENQYFVLGLGSTQAVVPGQRFTVFRYTLGGLSTVTELGEAVAVVVEGDWTTARMTSLRDVVEVGDFIAPHR